MTALHCCVGIIGDRDQKAYHRTEFASMALKPNVANVLSFLKRHDKITVVG
jgi:hypothetical protein